MFTKNTGITLGTGFANERRRYTVTPSLIGWVHTNTDHCKDTLLLDLDRLTRELTVNMLFEETTFDDTICTSSNVTA